LGQFKSCLPPTKSITYRDSQSQAEFARCWWIGTNLVRDVNTIAVSHDMKGSFEVTIACLSFELQNYDE
jgi:hypothetical protein